MIAFALAKSGQNAGPPAGALRAAGRSSSGPTPRRPSPCSWPTSCRSASAAWSWPGCSPRS
ncbi:MAG: hypothetical protein M0C28_07350 [Candidatus Moduliflexus flocculans]|nr:hypothetical protein [Candidatus Moduliflexus flocculans]